MRENGSILESLQQNRVNESAKVQKGKTYVLKRDMAYNPLDSTLEYNDEQFQFSDKFIKKYTGKYKGEDWIVFPKGTKCVMSRDSWLVFTIDGETVEILDPSCLGGGHSFEDFFM